MALSVVDLYQKILPKTNCGDCGYSTCLAFASMVVSEKLPIKNCPHLEPDVVRACEAELARQYAEGKWTKKDMSKEALEWARERSASMRIEDLPDRIGGTLRREEGGPVLALPYFNGVIRISGDGIHTADGEPLNIWEQVFVYNHMAQGGKAYPGRAWKGLEEIPNTVSKIKSMRSHVEEPLVERFSGDADGLARAAAAIGGEDVREGSDADVAMLFTPLPRVPVLLRFWDASMEDGFSAQVKLLFDETITEHLDIESIMFLSERIRQLLCGDAE